MDNLTPEKRSIIMRAIKSSNTKPELIVRKMLHSAGYRYRLHPKNLPGRPDIVFPVRRKAILIHGCFWHVHKLCGTARIPDSPMWREKLFRNIQRDKEVRTALRSLGWQTAVVWECEINKSSSKVLRKLKLFLDA
jgi:DNA mismatch endonuclease (patch repair protein)